MTKSVAFAVSSLEIYMHNCLAGSYTIICRICDICIHQSLSGRTLSYLASNVQLIANCSRQNLRSACNRTCFISRSIPVHRTLSVPGAFLHLNPACVEQFASRPRTSDTTKFIQWATQNNTVLSRQRPRSCEFGKCWLSTACELVQLTKLVFLVRMRYLVITC